MMLKKLVCIAFVAVLALPLAVTAQTVVWEDPDPADACFSATCCGLEINQIADPTGDPSRVTVGAIDFSIASTFSNMQRSGGATVDVPAFMNGENFTLSIEYYVPSNTSMNPDSSFHLQVEFRDANGDVINTFSGGFIDPTIDQDMWLSIVVSDVVPADATTMTPLFIFNTGKTTANGDAAYLDNLSFTVDADGSPDDTILWADADPVDDALSSENNGLVCDQVADPTGDPNRVTVGQVDFGAADWFSSVGPLTPVQITPEMYGVGYTFKADYFIPSNTTMSDNSSNGGQADSLYLNTFFDGNNAESGGFITVNNAGFDCWTTLEISGIIPDGAIEANAFVVLAEGGFGGVRSPDAGVAFYLDNIRFAVNLPTPGCEFPLGDVNQDGAVNLLDVGPFIDLLNSGVFQCEADANEDGAVNLLDVSPFVTILGGG